MVRQLLVRSEMCSRRPVMREEDYRRRRGSSRIFRSRGLMPNTASGRITQRATVNSVSTLPPIQRATRVRSSMLGQPIKDGAVDVHVSVVSQGASGNADPGDVGCKVAAAQNGHDVLRRRMLCADALVNDATIGGTGHESRYTHAGQQPAPPRLAGPGSHRAPRVRAWTLIWSNDHATGYR